MEQGRTALSATQEVMRDWGLPVVAVATLSHLVTYLEQEGTQSAVLHRVQAYRAAYGIAE